jgi:hypothetical protein
MKNIKMIDIGKEKTTQALVDEDILAAKNKYTSELSNRKVDIKNKISKLEDKIKNHSIKEGMLDKIISRTYIELENLKDNEFTRRGQKQAILIKQLEALSIIHDTLLKYEDMIQKYHKILIDLENNKLSSYIKIEGLHKEEEANDERISDVLAELHRQLKDSNNDLATAATGKSSFIDEIQKELESQNY